MTAYYHVPQEGNYYPVVVGATIYQFVEVITTLYNEVTARSVQARSVQARDVQAIVNTATSNLFASSILQPNGILTNDTILGEP